MYPFRIKTPEHRPDRAVCDHYSSYRTTLREDFENRCGYCDSLDLIRIRSFAIDHFIPQKPKDFTHTVPPNDYYNLIYACNYCNTYKSNKWPTKDASHPNDGKEGFIKPTIDDYKSRFNRSKEGRIIPVNEGDLVAKYIIDELKLWLPVHELMWKLEKLKSQNDKINSALEKITDETLRSEVQGVHYQVLLMLNQIQDSIFKENE
ncbi:HNH endonuclease [Fluviicola taffensis]|uniref:HNH domain-containing protein n=1 Tax=Fluviicola taffensis (strain DSM 16823 / NCIMB 13979 / RW262) TaxID=755732 RepID=F2IJU8_FLUTR|nr:HNH endonuclease [Fluviicola taffensis]AEA45007.1 hypothetical protein Fluta_3030 [Fluviicola taffensis DSM 16823]